MRACRFETLPSRVRCRSSRIETRRYQFRMGEFDHRLRFGESATHLFPCLLEFAIELLIEMQDRFGDLFDSLAHIFGSNVEVTPRLFDRAIEVRSRFLRLLRKESFQFVGSVIAAPV